MDAEGEDHKDGSDENEDSAMTEKKQRKQKTKPKKGKPVEIPVPKRGDVERDLLKIAKPKKSL